ncbi:myelin-oligodendrocyte glycoprotein-like [Centroberyx affinis]|uniref:myelin-oligodendrocyte glycoprotein-like n=1 Tax=Centroberyx affinis TaxID=166261 RepID=UPI003A5BB0ED
MDPHRPMTFTSAPLLALWILHLVSSSDGLEVVTAYTGQDVTLKCQSPNNAPIIMVEWTRPDLKPEYAFFYRNKRIYPSYQNPSFVGRVELLERDMKNGDQPLRLKNVNRNDAGTYECRVTPDGTRRRKRATEYSSSIILKVEDAMDGYSGTTDVHDSREHAVVGPVFAVVAIIGVIVGGLLKFRKHHEKKHLDKNSDPTSADEASDLQLVTEMK